MVGKGIDAASRPGHGLYETGAPRNRALSWVALLIVVPDDGRVFSLIRVDNVQSALLPRPITEDK